MEIDIGDTLHVIYEYPNTVSSIFTLTDISSYKGFLIFKDKWGLNQDDNETLGIFDYKKTKFAYRGVDYSDTHIYTLRMVLIEKYLTAFSEDWEDEQYDEADDIQ